VFCCLRRRVKALPTMPVDPKISVRIGDNRPRVWYFCQTNILKIGKNLTGGVLTLIPSKGGRWVWLRG
jgi:hypothetical protein